MVVTRVAAIAVGVAGVAVLVQAPAETFEALTKPVFPLYRSAVPILQIFYLVFVVVVVDRWSCREYRYNSDPVETIRCDRDKI